MNDTAYLTALAGALGHPYTAAASGMIVWPGVLLATRTRWNTLASDPWAMPVAPGVVIIVDVGKAHVHLIAPWGLLPGRDWNLDDLASCRPMLDALSGGDPTPLLPDLGEPACGVDGDRIVLAGRRIDADHARRLAGVLLAAADLAER